MLRWTAPRLVTLRARGTRDAPYLLGVTRKLFREIRVAPFAVSTSGCLGVRKPIDLSTAGLAATAEIKPCEGILVGPEKGSADVVEVGVLIRISFPCVPCVRRKRMRRRSDAEEIHCRELAVLVIAQIEVSLGFPSV